MTARHFTARAELVAAIAREIDPEAPTTQATRVLAAAVLELVEKRTPEEANQILEDVRALGQKHPRPLGYGRRA